MEVTQRVKEIIAAELHLKSSDIPDNSNIKDLGADSLSVVNMVLAFEGEFSISVPDDAVDSVITVKDAVDLVVDQLSRKV